MRKVLLSLLAVGLLAGTAAAQCGPWGCPTRQPQTIEKHREKHVEKTRPTPAWRYERAVGHRAAVVRVECDDGTPPPNVRLNGLEYIGGRISSKGSGVLVRWDNRIVVLTARHVVQDAKQVYVKFHKGKKHKAKVLKVDKRWDCAVLDIGPVPDGIEPAELAYGNDAMFQEGDRLETCGYGPDEKLACNSGLFINYRRRSDSPDEGPDDWMAVSGPARQGDSGGPVFDAQGRVVGVLWGTDGRTVICVQPGRIHALLTEVTTEQLAITERRPTPPALGPLEPVNQGCSDGQCTVDQTKGGADKKPLLPWRQDAVADQKAQDQRIDRLIGAMERQQAAPPPPAVNVEVKPQQPEKPPVDKNDPPLWLWGLGGLAVAVGIFYVGQKN